MLIETTLLLLHLPTLLGETPFSIINNIRDILFIISNLKGYLYLPIV